MRSDGGFKQLILGKEEKDQNMSGISRGVYQLSLSGGRACDAE